MEKVNNAVTRDLFFRIERKIPKRGIIIAAAMTAMVIFFWQPAEARMFGKGCDNPSCMHGQHPGPRHGMIFGDVEKLQRMVDLSDEQVSQVENLNSKHKQSIEKLHDKIAPLAEELQQQLTQDQPDLQKVRQTVEAMSALKVEMQMSRIQHRLAIEKILTKEQRDELIQWRQSRMEQRGEKAKSKWSRWTED